MTNLEEARKRWLIDEPSFFEFASLIENRIKSSILNLGIHAEVSKRTKEIDSLIKKLTYDSLGDKAGVRVIVQYKPETAKVLRCIKRALACSDQEDKLEKLGEEKVGYLSIHLDVTLRRDDPKAQEFPPSTYRAELQIRTGSFWPSAGVYRYRLTISGDCRPLEKQSMLTTTEPKSTRRLRGRASLTPERQPLIVVLVGQKGGAGKTTAATETAFALVALGHKVLLIDRDRQHTATIWAKVGLAGGYPVPNTASLDALRRGLAEASKGYDYVLVDCPPGDQEEQREALLLGHLAIVPCGADTGDLWALHGHPLDPEAPTTLQSVREAEALNPALRTFVLPSRIDSRTAFGRDARKNLTREGGIPLLQEQLSQSAWYAPARIAGVGVVAFAPQSKAAREVMALARRVVQLRLEGLEPIVLLGDEVLDGRNRLAACEANGTVPWTVAWEGQGGSPTAYVLSLNLQRRHLTPVQLAAIAISSMPLFAAEAAQRMLAGTAGTVDPGVRVTPGSRNEAGRAVVQAARAVGAGVSATKTLHAVARQAPEVLELARDNRVNVKQAKQVAELPEKPRASAVQRIAEGEPAKKVLPAPRRPARPGPDACGLRWGSNLCRKKPHGSEEPCSSGSYTWWPADLGLETGPPDQALTGEALSRVRDALGHAYAMRPILNDRARSGCAPMNKAIHDAHERAAWLGGVPELRAAIESAIESAKGAEHADGPAVTERLLQYLRRALTYLPSAAPARPAPGRPRPPPPAAAAPPGCWHRRRRRPGARPQRP